MYIQVLWNTENKVGVVFKVPDFNVRINKRFLDNLSVYTIEKTQTQNSITVG